MAEEIRAEMVANVWKVVATKKNEVEDGDAIAVLESMKMEIPVAARIPPAGSPRRHRSRGDLMRRGG